MIAQKLSLALAIGLLAMPTGTARPGRVPWINQDHWDAREPGLVFYAQAQVRERPVAETAAKVLSNRWLDTGSDVFEVFKSDTDAECLGFRDKPLADRMVDVLLEAGLSPAHAFQFPPSAFGSFPLMLLAGRLPATPVAVHLGTRKCLPSAVSGEVHDTQVYAEEALDFNGRRFLEFDGAVEEEHAMPVHKVALAADAVQVGGLIVAEDVGDHQPTERYRQDAAPVAVLEAQDSFVVGHSTVWTEDWTDGLAGGGEGFRSLGDGADSHLSRQAEAFPKLAVAEFLNGRTAEHAGLEAGLGGEGSSGIEAAHRVKQSGCWIGVRE